MKIKFTLFLMAILLLSSLSSFSQTASTMFSYRGATLEEVINQIENQTEFTFLVLDKGIDLNKTINTKVSGQTLESALNQLFVGTNIQYNIMDKQIVLSEKQKSPSPTVANQSNLQIKGVVTDSEGLSIIGASVVQKGTSNGTTTDVDGEFNINVPKGAVLQFSFIGYTTQEIKVENQNPLKVTLSEDTQVLDEVVVVAFGTMKKEAFTGAAGTLKTDDIIKSQQTNAAQALAGRVAGLQITNSTGEVGGQPTITVRGIGSINAKNDPLFIVDGMPYDGDIGSINPADIESMTVLKDAASNALYGARGANGVIMITTKKGEHNRTSITVDAKWGINQSARPNYDLITDPAEHYEVYYKARYNKYINSIKEPMTHNEAHVQANKDIMNTLSGNGPGYMVFTVPQGQLLIGENGRINPNATPGNLYTDPNSGIQYWLQADDWEKEALRNGFRQEYNATFSTGGKNSNTYLSMGYLTNQGIIEGSDQQRISGRLKSDLRLTDWLTVGGNVSFTNNKLNKRTFGEDIIGAGNIWSVINGQAPIYPVYLRDADRNIMKDEQGRILYDHANSSSGIYGVSRGTGGNAIFDNKYSKNWSKGNTVTAAGFADIRFLEDFKLSLNLNIYNEDFRRHQYNSAYAQSFGTASTNGYVYELQSSTFSYNLQQLLNYNKTLGGVHHISALLGHEYYDKKYSYVSGSKTNVAFDDNQSLNGAVTMNGAPGGASTRYNVEGYLFRGMYDYDSKYYGSISFRRDASSRFHPDNRWGNFWSLGGAWIINKENWYNIGWLDELKFKASVGSQGNDNIGSYLFDDQYSISANGNNEISLAFKQKGNKDITWETNMNYNTGFEFSALKGRVAGSVDYYYRLTSDMLYNFKVATSNGYTNYWANIGDMRNMGFEFDFNFGLMRSKDFNLDFNFNLATLSNKILKLPADKQTTTSGNYKGYALNDDSFVSLFKYFIAEDLPLNSYYIPTYAGVNENGEAMWYKDILDENGNVTGRETTVKSGEATDYIHGSSLPDVYGGFGTTLVYKNFDFSANFNYSLGGVIYDYGYATRLSAPSGSSTGSFHKDIYKSWSKENTNTDFPRFYADESNGQNARSDRFLTSASFLNFQNLNIGYTFPKKILQKLDISKLRVYFQCENIFFVSARKGFDPRQAGSDGRVNPQSYSQTRSISMGINLNF